MNVRSTYPRMQVTRKKIKREEIDEILRPPAAGTVRPFRTTVLCIAYSSMIHAELLLFAQG
jgi:hypothetical protein